MTNIEYPNLEQMKQFNESNLPDSDVVALADLELFMRQRMPRLDLGRWMKPLAVGSGNAAAMDRILPEKADAVFADKSTYEAKLASIRGIDGAILAFTT